MPAGEARNTTVSAIFFGYAQPAARNFRRPLRLDGRGHVGLQQECVDGARADHVDANSSFAHSIAICRVKEIGAALLGP